MRFQLLVGKHQDVNGDNYEVGLVKDDDGKVISRKLPIIESDSDLVKIFGSNKFRKLSGSLPTDAPGLSENIVPGASDLDKAAQQGAAGLKHGDVTESFPKAKDAGLKVYRQEDGQYFVSDSKSNELLSEMLNSRIKVHTFVKQYTEG